MQKRHRDLALLLQPSKHVCNQILRTLGILRENPDLIRHEKYRSMLMMIQAATCTINYTFAYTE